MSNHDTNTDTHTDTDTDTDGSNWGRWGSDDEAGALNLVDADTVRAAAGSVRDGHVISLAQPIGPRVGVPPHRRAPQRFMDRDYGDYAAGARSPDGFRFAEDTVMFGTHSGTHLDALAHAWSGDELYNGHPAASVRSTRGAGRCGAEALRPIVTRGVLMDLAHDGPIPARTAIDAEQVEAAYRAAEVAPRAGDAVLLRTGWWELHRGAPEYFDDEPGLDDTAAGWLAARDVAVVGADNYAVEVQPSMAGTTFPVHLTLMHRHGVPLLENLDLTGLAVALSRAGRATFLLVLAPIPLAGSTAGPVAPVAVL